MYVRLCVTRTLSHKFRHFLSFIHSRKQTRTNACARTHLFVQVFVLDNIYETDLYIHAGLHIHTSNLWIYPPAEYVTLQALLFRGFQLVSKFICAHFCRLSSFPWAFSFFCAALSSLPKLPTRYVNLCTNLWSGGRTWSTRSLVVAINTSPHIQHIGECMQLTLFTYIGRQKHASIHWSATHLHYERICLRQSQQGLNSIANKWCVPSCPGKSWCFFDTCDWFFWCSITIDSLSAWTLRHRLSWCLFSPSLVIACVYVDMCSVKEYEKCQHVVLLALLTCIHM